MVNGKYGRSVYSVFSTMVTMVDGCEILHQLIDGKHPIILYGCQPSVVQDLGNHPQYGRYLINMVDL